MKKLIATLMIAALLLTGSALAATYDTDNIAFEYDDSVFKVEAEDNEDGEAYCILYSVNDELENTFVNISVAKLEDDETFPTLEAYTKEANEDEEIEVTVDVLDEWAGFKDVYHYDSEYADEETHFHASTFTAPVYKDDKVIAIADIYACQDVLEDEDAAMQISDAISEILDTLKITTD